MEEMAACLGVHVDTLRDNYFQVIEEERGRGKLEIRDSQFRMMKKNSTQMGIWLGRVILGQNPDGGGLSSDQTGALEAFTDSIDRAREEDSPSQP